MGRNQRQIQCKRNAICSNESSGDSDDSKIGLPQFECERKGLFTKMATDRCKLEGLVNVVGGTENLKNVKKAFRFKYFDLLMIGILRLKDVTLSIETLFY